MSAEAETPVVLKALCDHFGIATTYEDVWGECQQVGTDTLIAVLAQFEVDASNAQLAEAALKLIQRQTGQDSLPPVRAISSDTASWTIAVSLPRATGRCHWRVTLEDGQFLQGEAAVSHEPATEQTTLDNAALVKKTLTVDVALPPGYHRLRLDEVEGDVLLVSAPARCYRPTAAAGGNRLWGPVVQLYALRSERNWGMGDFTDLADFVTLMAQQGADLVGLNPLHALSTKRPTQASPYSPSSRRLLNVLYIDPEAVIGFDECTAAKTLVASATFGAQLTALRASPLVDYEKVAAAKFEVLKLLFVDFRRLLIEAIGDPIFNSFRDFVHRGGEALRNHAIFEAMQEAAKTTQAGSTVAPINRIDAASPQVQTFASEHADDVMFHQYLQWLADAQLQRAVDTGRAFGMAVGLYLDLAISVDAGGSDAWGDSALFAASARVGAPADVFNPNGQDWGLRPLRADRLRADGYRYFIDTLRANMRHAGALRIDHVMGLMRLFWIPDGHTARTGTYVHFAVDEMLAIVALESQRNRCMVIGEDLGTVAPEMREAMAQRDLLSYRLLYFERGAAGFTPPADYPSNALVAVSTHDLATLPGWWSGEDLRVRLAQGLYPAPEIFERQLLDRARERAELLAALRQAGLITHEDMATFAFCTVPPPELIEAVHVFLASTPCTLLVVQPEDFLEVTAQANLPGTTTEQPNWRRKLPLNLKDLARNDRLFDIARSLAQTGRGHGRHGGRAL